MDMVRMPLLLPHQSLSLLVMSGTGSHRPRESQVVRETLIDIAGLTCVCRKHTDEGQSTTLVTCSTVTKIIMQGPMIQHRTRSHLSLEVRYVSVSLKPLNATKTASL